MKQQIENNSYACHFYKEEEYNDILNIEDRSITNINGNILGYINLYIDFPFDVPNDSIIYIRIQGLHNQYKVYYGNFIHNKPVSFQIPKIQKYPGDYTFSISLFVPSKNAICNWGLEDGIIITDPVNYSHSWRVKLLAGVNETETGARHTIIFEPM